MIICSCNVLSDKQLRKAAEEMRADPNGKVPTPGAVFRHLGCRPRCGSCFPSVIDIIHEKTSEETNKVKNETGCQSECLKAAAE
ncbi:BFD-like [2Fe-2S] binding protein [Roseibium hamelinense]|uniref:BFD-like [2Fe-2S] binding protein n=1 Tax=Roseibium hamelinense TaxID=150831 RepID=A0A562SHG7_9HYPH|nr:(2Fe-2S)-binding protein [Roseibium hamelinense]MTI43958.1 (2Fe-2S)-binding protein [Roseibium hamelinense]TWI80747.1 BFD-like [2Fe-2S] binding protein [Roseibium hamelinense]